MQERLNNEIIKAVAGTPEKLFNTAKKDLKDGTCDSVTISNFKEGETIFLKGLEFRIRDVNLRRKKLTLKLKTKERK